MQDSVSFKHIKPDSMGSTFAQFNSQSGQFPALAEFSTQLNNMLKDELSSTVPDLFPALEQEGKNTLAESKGLLPADVAGNAMRTAGLTTLGSGGSQFSKYADARQLGLTSLDLTQRALQATPVLTALAKETNPVSPTNFIFTPQAIQQRSDQFKILNSGRDIQQQLTNAGIQQNNTDTAISSAALLAGLFSKSGSSTTTTNNNTTSSGGGFDWSNVFGSFNSGGGSGGLTASAGSGSGGGGG
ncbi:MAG: hypothetical protein ABI162_07110 [Luteolibacter sp.]